jgi:UDP-N-acetylmuramyl pentapeptide phosphotransferase/UDP-N-acetylglucosamine-1-phosphate transferase
VFVAIGIQHSMRMRRTVLSAVAPLAVQYFSTLSQMRYDLKKKRVHHHHHHHHHHKHQGLDPLIRSVSTVTTAHANVYSVFQLFSILVICSGMILKGFGFVAFFASVEASSICIHLSCLVCF